MTPRYTSSRRVTQMAPTATTSVASRGQSLAALPAASAGVDSRVTSCKFCLCTASLSIDPQSHGLATPWLYSSPSLVASSLPCGGCTMRAPGAWLNTRRDFVQAHMLRTSLCARSCAACRVLTTCLQASTSGALRAAALIHPGVAHRTLWTKPSRIAILPLHPRQHMCVRLML